MPGARVPGAHAVDQDRYRDAMARFGAAVSVVTTDGPQGRGGLTVSAVCSVTDTPPTLLVCINRASHWHDALLGNGVLCVNALTGAQQDLSPLFAGFTGVSLEDCFAAAQWDILATGAPVLKDALVSFDCRISQTQDVGTHTVMFCTVQATRLGTAREGLIYFGRDYHRLTHQI